MDVYEARQAIIENKDTMVEFYTDEFEAFEAAVDAPLASTAKFERLFRRPSPFGRTVEVDE